jgi:hypothetical protein
MIVGIISHAEGARMIVGIISHTEGARMIECIKKILQKEYLDVRGRK